MQFKGISILSFGGHFVQLSKPICAILLEGIIRNISVKLFWIITVFPILVDGIMGNIHVELF